jgi:hypothetical protein
MNSQYETLYGVGLLDDLHNYFPAVLYEPQAFQTVPGLLRYIHTQARNRFDLFSLGQREYRTSHPAPPPAPAPAPAPPSSGVSSVHLQATSVDLSGNQAPTNSTLPSPVRRALGGFLAGSPIGTSLQYTLNLPEQEDEEDETQLTTHLLAALLQLPAAPLTRNMVLPNLNNGRLTMEQMIYGRNNMDQFLQPVVVRPTVEQISANTTVGRLVSDTENTCAICQDTLTAEQEGRKLNACGHWFHKNCIDTWLEGNVHCPVCRHDIREHGPQESEEARRANLEADLH